MSNVLDKAKEIVFGDRERTYGHPAKNLQAIAELWNTYLVNRGLLVMNQTPLNAQDVAIMMALLKIARLANQPDHEDSLIDAAGYIALVERSKENP